MNQKKLIVYYSWSGNTASIAKLIQKATGAELFEINTIKPYPLDYTETTIVAKEELRQNARPELTKTVKNLDDYHVIYLGYPNWWGTFPMAVFTFLESYNFSKKTIIPFCTLEGSGMGRSENDIKKLCPNSNVLSGVAIRGSSVLSADKIVLSWLKK